MDKQVKELMKRISLKKVKTFNGREGVGLNAEIYFDKVKIAEAFDDASGGPMDFNVDFKQLVKYRELEDLILALPEIELYPGFGSKPLIGKPDLAWFVDQVLADKEKEKFQKKLEKDFLTKICVGKPNGDNYASYDLKRDLNIYPATAIQKFIDDKVKPALKDGEVILNTNLKKMGIKI